MPLLKSPHEDGWKDTALWQITNGLRHQKQELLPYPDVSLLNCGEFIYSLVISPSSLRTTSEPRFHLWVKLLLYKCCNSPSTAGVMKVFKPHGARLVRHVGLTGLPKPIRGDFPCIF